MRQTDPTLRVCALLIPVAALLAGLFLLALVGLPQWHQGRADYSVPVRALVVESTRQPVVSVLDHLWPRHAFSYHYLYRGELYVSRAYRQRGGLAEAVSRHPAGSVVTAWVDPQSPERAVVEPGPSRTELAGLAVGFLLCAVGLLGFFRLVAHHRALLRPDDPVAGVD